MAITNSSGTTIGYSCYVSGTFVWLAAGGGWSTSIRVAAPASAPVGADYTFYDTSGNDLRLDSTSGGGSATPGNRVSFALRANQPAEVVLLGAAGAAPSYSSTATGSAYAVFYCPDAATCANVLPQLRYSAQPGSPWSLSAPIVWDTELWTQWSTLGADDGGGRRVSLVIYNVGMTAASYTVRIYDGTGSLAGTGQTPVLPPLKALSGGALGQGGTYAALLSDVIAAPLPSGVFKILIDGGAQYSAVEALQFDGPSATALQVGYDSAPSVASSAEALSAKRLSIRSARVESMPRPVFRELAK